MPTWFARRVIDLIDKLTDVYYKLKYGAMARRLGRPGVEPNEQRGFIIVQIDGLSYKHLMQAIDGGYMPYVEQLLDDRRLKADDWQCGLPSSTPAVQAGMMFGNRFDIPGYRWYEKDRQATVSPRHLDQIRVVRERISRGRTGILRGGSCYVSMFDGDADLALFTLSTLHSQHFFESIRGVGFLLLFLLSPYRLLRTLVKTAVSYLTGLSHRLVTLIQSFVGRRTELRVFKPFDVFSPLLHAAGDALFTEVQTFGVMLDIYRCVPAIYTNYTSYDEAAHNLGPDHPAAFRILRGLDKHIHQIDRMRAYYRRREYDLYILSDHGNTPSIPFSQREGESLEQYIAAQIGEDLSIDGQMVYRHLAHSREKARYLLREVQILEENLSPRLRPVLAAIRRYADRHMFPTRTLDYDLKRQRDVVVSVSGPLAHIYFKVSPRPLDLIEVILLYPQLLDRLLATSGIEVLIGRVGERTIVLGREGGLVVMREDQRIIDEPHPLAPFGDISYVANQIHTVTHFPHSGDLVIMGSIEPDGKMVTFEKQASTHGGMGGPQGYPFILWPPRCPLTPEALNDARDLYPYFMRRYQRRFLAEDEEPVAKVEAPA